MSAKVKKQTFKQVCSICGEFLGGDVNSNNISHGYCKDCGEALYNDFIGIKPKIRILFCDPKNRSNHVMVNFNRVNSNMIEKKCYFWSNKQKKNNVFKSLIL